jgi:hypothetical protein
MLTHQYDDLIGAIPINVVEALLAVAAAINRLAAAQEKAAVTAGDVVHACQTIERASQQLETLMAGDGPGHA